MIGFRFLSGSIRVEIIVMILVIVMDVAMVVMIVKYFRGFCSIYVGV